jgi:hypothetical protein
MAGRKEEPTPENEIFASKIKSIDPEVAVRKLGRQANLNPENRGSFPDMTRNNEPEPEEGSGGEEVDLSHQYKEPPRVDKQAGVTHQTAPRELPYVGVPALDHVPKQNMPPLNKGHKPASREGESQNRVKEEVPPVKVDNEIGDN